MKTLLLSSSIALMLLSSTAAFSAPRHEGGDDHGRQGHGQQDRNDHERRNDGRRDNDRRDNDRRGNDRNDNDRSNQRWAQNRWHDNGRHLGQRKHAFRRGEHVPTVYLQPQYYVRDYRSYHLAPPPRGYRWVRPDNGHYLLVATATGLISQLLGY